MAPAPGAPPNLGIMAPMVTTWEKTCDTEYQEVAGNEGHVIGLCACETFAIGRCAVCEQPVCGIHSSLRDGERMCQIHVGRFDIAIAKQQYDSTRNGLVTGWKSLLTNVVDVVKQYDDSVLRFILIATARHSAQIVEYLGEDRMLRHAALDILSDTDRVSLKADMTAAMRAILSPLVPSLTSVFDATAEDPIDWALNYAVFAEWLRDRLGAPSVMFTIVDYSRGRNGRKIGKERGIWIREGFSGRWVWPLRLCIQRLSLDQWSDRELRKEERSDTSEGIL